MKRWWCHVDIRVITGQGNQGISFRDLKWVSVETDSRTRHREICKDVRIKKKCSWLAVYLLFHNFNLTENNFTGYCFSMNA